MDKNWAEWHVLIIPEKEENLKLKNHGAGQPGPKARSYLKNNHGKNVWSCDSSGREPA
jgi:hypothetical protein